MKVLLVDDHPLIISALKNVIQGLGDAVTVVGVDGAAGARHLLQTESDFDLVLLDLALGDADGFDVLAELRQTWPALPVVVVSASDRASDVIRAIDLGAMGFVPKRSSNAQLFDALHVVMSGGLYVPSMVLGIEPAPAAGGDTAPAAMWQLADPGPVAEHARAEPHQQAPSLENLGLTPRQTEVLALLLQGLPNKLIARELGLSVETVKDHVAAVLRALGVGSRTQAVLAVSQMSQAQGGIVARKATAQR
jgi:DNA-binding NarL/FixJ family response regulator